MPDRLITLVKVAVTLGGLAFIVSQIDPVSALRRMLAADPLWLLIAFALVIAGLVVRAYRWQLLLAGLGVTLPFPRLVRLYFVGHFFSAFLPTGFGGDVVRVVEVTRFIPGEIAAGTVLLDRLTGLLALFAVGLVALAGRPDTLPAAQGTFLLVVAVIGLAVGGVVLDGRLLQRLGRYLPAPFSPEGQGVVARLLDAVAAVGWRALRGALLVSLFFNVIQVMWWWAAARALGIEISMAYLFLVVPLLALTLLVPAVGGFGARESAATLLFDGAVVAPGAVALAGGSGFALSALVFLLERLAGLPGGPLYLWRLRRKNVITTGGGDGVGA